MVIMATRRKSTVAQSERRITLVKLPLMVLAGTTPAGVMFSGKNGLIDNPLSSFSVISFFFVDIFSLETNAVSLCKGNECHMTSASSSHLEAKARVSSTSDATWTVSKLNLTTTTLPRLLSLLLIHVLALSSSNSAAFSPLTIFASEPSSDAFARRMSLAEEGG